MADHFFIVCQGALSGPRYLDGRTADGTVGLAQTTDGVFTGTRWARYEPAQNIFFFECLGDVPGNRFLDGRTGDGTVGLAPNTDPPFTGTRWAFAVPFD